MNQSARNIKPFQDAGIVVPSPSVRNTQEGAAGEPAHSFVEGFMHSFRGGGVDHFPRPGILVD